MFYIKTMQHSGKDGLDRDADENVFTRCPECGRRCPSISRDSRTVKAIFSARKLCAACTKKVESRLSPKTRSRRRHYGSCERAAQGWLLERSSPCLTV